MSYDEDRDVALETLRELCLETENPEIRLRAAEVLLDVWGVDLTTQLAFDDLAPEGSA